MYLRTNQAYYVDFKGEIMKQSWQKEIDMAFGLHISVNRHVAKDMLDSILSLETALRTITSLKYNKNAASDIMRDIASQALNKNNPKSQR